MKMIIAMMLCMAVHEVVNAQLFTGSDTARISIPVHAPVMIKQDSVYYVFCTVSASPFSHQPMEKTGRKQNLFLT